MHVAPSTQIEQGCRVDAIAGTLTPYPASKIRLRPDCTLNFFTFMYCHATTVNALAKRIIHFSEVKSSILTTKILKIRQFCQRKCSKLSTAGHFVGPKDTHKAFGGHYPLVPPLDPPLRNPNCGNISTPTARLRLWSRVGNILSTPTPIPAAAKTADSDSRLRDRLRLHNPA